MSLGSVVKKEEPIQWDDIKDIVLKDVESKNGDLCLVKLSGATVEGHGVAVNHVLALIKLKSTDSPYKYVVYDYQFGALGCSDEAHLKFYFELLLDYYVGFYHFNLEKQTEASESCKQFISHIRPLEEPSLAVDCAREYWNKKRLLLLAKYGDMGSMCGIKLVLEHVKKLEVDADRDEIYQVLFENKNITLQQLMVLSIKENNIDLIEKILNHALCLRSIITHPKSGFLHDKKIAQLVYERKVPAIVACQVFHNIEAIVLAAHEVDARSLQFADKMLVATLVRKGEITLRDAMDALTDGSGFRMGRFFKGREKAYRTTAERVEDETKPVY